MKRLLEFTCQLLGIPTVYVPLLVIAGFIIALFFMGCGFQYPGPPFPGGSGKLYSEKIEPQYQHPSDSAPADLKGFYDPQLTQDLNKGYEGNRSNWETVRPPDSD